MGVKPEELKPAKVKLGYTNEVACRSTDGRWTLHLSATVDVRLPDGRTLQARRMVKIRCQQIIGLKRGRPLKPLPARAKGKK